MIESGFDGLERLLEVPEVHDPTRLRVDGCLYVDDDLVRVAVEARTLVSLRNVGQTVRGFERELAKDFHY